jgi:hypothetical protein
LDTLVEIGQISSEAAADAKASVSELHHALVSATTEERELTVQSAQLAKERDVSPISVLAWQASPSQHNLHMQHGALDTCLNPSMPAAVHWGTAFVGMLATI